MAAHATVSEHAHPTPGTYFKVGIVLFVLTALEVASYEMVFGESAQASVQAILGPIFVPVLLVLSAAKFALVAMFYMHLKQDGRLLSGLFVFPLIIAVIIAVALMLLFSYLALQHPA